MGAGRREEMEEQTFTQLQRETLQEAEALVQAAPSVQEALQRLAELLTERVRTFSWAGFYLLRNGRLELGPHSGRNHPPHPSTASTAEGTRGLAAASAETVLLPSLRRDPRWLSCPAAALSEIIVPIKAEGVVRGEIDVDGKKANGFDLRDRRFLEALAERLAPLLARS